MTVVPNDKPNEPTSQEKIEAPSLPKNEDVPNSQVTDPNKNNEEVGEKESEAQQNWKAFREARKRDRAEKEAAERKALEKEREIEALKAAMEAAFPKSSTSPQAYQNYYAMNEEETEEQKIDRRVKQILNEREEKIKKEEFEREQKEFPNRLARDFPDFEKVCSQENIDYIEFHYPEVARAIQRLPNGYDKWHDAYHIVKKLIPNHANVKKETMKAEFNSQKPRSISSTGVTQSDNKSPQSWQEIEQRRAANWERMRRTMGQM